MFKFSRRSYYGYGKGKRRQRFSPLWLILAIPVFLIVLELMARMFLSFKAKSADLAVYERELAIVTAYRLKFVTKNQKPFDGLSDRGSLVAQRRLSVGYQILGNQKSDYWQINEQGFREDEPVPLKKPKDEIRIFILGGSTAFGQWNLSNQATIASKLEARLQERVAQQKRSPATYRPDVFPFFKPLRSKAFALPPKIREGKYRVINAAVPGYTSGNQLAQLALQILPYKPDLIIVLDGYTDLMLPSSETETDIPKLEEFMTDAPGHFGTYLSQSFNQWLKDTSLVKATQYWVLRPQLSAPQKSMVIKDEDKPLAAYLPEDDAELKLRLDRYRENHKQMLRLSTGAGIPLIIAVQPEITGRRNLSHDEKEILAQLGEDYTAKIKTHYPKFVQGSKQLEKAFPKNVKALNFYNLNDKFPHNTFSDAIHLTEEANTEIAEQLYYAITGLEKIQIIPKYLNLD
ncbi:MAG: SGNH/GDSL hydrolase family protein [Moorea sp. SIO2B7]|nr:SGNH/GDSL hydrolase family protein [Moorena sp. SIO2B7]